ncbi:hypothetical protein MMC27_001137 [Xylographa pallens]|nr:hypothetical protein [Xylographa pallens]
MRFESRGRVVEVTCAVDKVDCTEYNHGSEQSSSPENIQECFISAETNQTIRLDISLQEPRSEFLADLVVDGVIRDTANFRRMKSGMKYYSFEHGMWKEGRRTSRWQLKIKELPPHTSEAGDSHDLLKYRNVLVGTIEVRIFCGSCDTNMNRVPAYCDMYSRAKDVFYGVQGIEPTHRIGGGIAIGISKSQKSAIESTINGLRSSTKPFCAFRFSYRSQKCLQLAGVISASPTPKAHASIEPPEDEQLQAAAEEPSTEKDGDTKSLIAVTTSKVSIMTDEVSIIEENQRLDVLAPALLIDGTSAISLGTSEPHLSVLRASTALSSNATNLVPETDSVPSQYSSRLRNPASNELYRQTSPSATDSIINSGLLLADHEGADDAGHYSPLFVSPEPRKVSVLDDSSRNFGPPLAPSSHGHPIYIAPTRSSLDVLTDSYDPHERSINSALRVDIGNLTPMWEMPNTLKRSVELSPLLGQKAESPSSKDDIKQVFKRRKNDIKVLKAELEALTQKKADSARRVEEARRRREEQERILNEEYEALEQEKLKVLQSIAADQEAEEEHLRGLEDDSD